MKKNLFLILAGIMMVAFTQCGRNSEAYQDANNYLNNFESAIDTVYDCYELESIFSDFYIKTSIWLSKCDDKQDKTMTKREKASLKNKIEKLREVAEKKDRTSNCEDYYGLKSYMRPPFEERHDEFARNEINVMHVIPYKNDSVFVDDLLLPLYQLKDKIKTFMASDPDNTNAQEMEIKHIEPLGDVPISKKVVLIQTDTAAASIKTEIALLHDLDGILKEWKNEISLKYCNKGFNQLNEDQAKAIQKIVSSRIIIDDGGSSHMYVDLGLPSGTLWATHNFGAKIPEDYGEYYAWSDVRTRTKYNWCTYDIKYCYNGRFLKYCSHPIFGYKDYSDTLTMLEPADDITTASWGIEWSIPSCSQWEELYQNTTSKWTTRNGVTGQLFMASNGRSLFLPAAGYKEDDKLYYAGNNGYYWTNELQTDSVYEAWSYSFNDGGCSLKYNKRCQGLTIRSVRSR